MRTPTVKPGEEPLRPEAAAALRQRSFTGSTKEHPNARCLPKDPQPAWRGYSIGKWEGDVFVVDTPGFNDRAWLDVSGNTHSDALHIQERYQRRDFGHRAEIAASMRSLPVQPDESRRPVAAGDPPPSLQDRVPGR